LRPRSYLEDPLSFDLIINEYAFVEPAISPPHQASSATLPLDVIALEDISVRVNTTPVAILEALCIPTIIFGRSQPGHYIVLDLSDESLTESGYARGCTSIFEVVRVWVRVSSLFLVIMFPRVNRLRSSQSELLQIIKLRLLFIPCK
jgi:hypothetical protein